MMENLNNWLKLKESMSSYSKKFNCYLEQTVKHEENFTINLDFMMSRILQDNPESVLGEKKTKHIIRKKVIHRQVLTEFKDCYKEQIDKERKIVKKIQEHKKTIQRLDEELLAL